jgi:glucose/arabinose dehydrogenase
MRLFLAVAACIVLASGSAFAQLQSQVFVTGLDSPIGFVQDPTQPNVQFVIEQAGRIRVIQNGALLQQPFLDITGLVVSGGEQGLLGLAFAPDYLTSRRFFVNFTDMNGNTVVARFTRSVSNALVADPSSQFDLGWPGCQRFIAQPFSNHNGGNLQFGDDGFLYIGLGDGGSGGDPFNNAQSRTSLLGKMLRIDVNVPDSDPRGFAVPADNPRPFGLEVVTQALCTTAIPYQQTGMSELMWDIGLRNPWRYAFDLLSHGGSGGLVIADVGQDAWEEVDYEPFASGNRNYGWRNREGANDYNQSVAPLLLPLHDPIYQYAHTVGVSVIGGYVYRGTTLGAPYFGRYFFADLNGRVWSMRLDKNPSTGEATAADVFEHTTELGGTAKLGNITTFGIDANCELYVVSYNPGTIYRISSAASAAMAGGCAPPDPFATIGGGVFVGGSWLPPNSPTSQPTSLGTPSPTPPPSASSGGCTPPAPVADWVCINGGWLPPNHPLALAAAAGGSSPPPSTPPPTSPPPSTASCTPPAPVSDWVCVNGGWLPPNHPLAIAAAAAGSSPPPSTPPPSSPPPATGCTTPDPFKSIPGLVGVCINGGWIPSNNPRSGG